MLLRVLLILLVCCWTVLIVKLTLLFKSVCDRRRMPTQHDKGSQCTLLADGWQPKIENMTINALRHELKLMGFESDGVKSELVARLTFLRRQLD
jgi:hypothetical protein